MSFRKKSTPNRPGEDRTFKSFKDEDDEDVERLAGSSARARNNKQQNALDRVAAALEPLDDDDDDLDMSDDELDGDFDDFNPRSEEPESLI